MNLYWGQHVFKFSIADWRYELYSKRGDVLRSGKDFASREEAEAAMEAATREYLK